MYTSKLRFGVKHDATSRLFANKLLLNLQYLTKIKQFLRRLIYAKRSYCRGTYTLKLILKVIINLKTNTIDPYSI
jgi:hypothetical protein